MRVLKGCELLTAIVFTVTAYQAVPEQTDDSPNWTSIGHHVHPYGAAASQDLIKNETVCYGDVVRVPGFGLFIVNDTMNKRHTKHIDLFVENLAAEKRVGMRRLSVDVIKSETRRCKK